MTMFSHDIGASEGTIPDLLHKITNAPGAGDDATKFTTVMGAIAAAFPKLLTIIPSPMKRWADQLKRELGIIAQEVWSFGKANNAHMEAKILELLSM
jgi:hypothetical protein